MSAPEVHGPSDVAELRTWLAEQWRTGHPFADHAAYFHAARSAAAPGRFQDAGLLAAAASYSYVERLVLEHATLYWVSEDMVDLLLAAAASVPDDVKLEDLDLHDPTGLVVFAKPWFGIDIENPSKLVQVDAMSWGAAKLPAFPARGRPQEGLALTVSCYRRIDFADGMSPEEMQMTLLLGTLEHAQQHKIPRAEAHERFQTAVVLDEDGSIEDLRVIEPGGEDVPPPDDREAFALTGETWAPLGRTDWPIERAIGEPTFDGISDEDLASMVEDRKIMAAFWTLLHQEGIAATTTTRVPRPTARRAERAGVPREKARDVQVVTLRKLERTEHEPEEGDEGSKREWSHRWLVSGHWRWQPYGPGRKLRRLTYVRPHVKGPEDKPLRTPTRVNAWVR